jgi:hypothetical protein
MTIFFKPRRTDKLYYAFMATHFMFQVVLSETLYLFSEAITRYTVGWVLLRLAFCLLGFYCGLRLRKTAAGLDADELSSFLKETVFKRSLCGLAPTVFLSFEAIPCLLMGGEDGCKTALYTSMFLQGKRASR